MSASGMPRRTVRKMLTTSPMFDETRERDERTGGQRIVDERTKIADELLGVVVYQPTLLYGLLYCGEVGIGQYHVSSEFGNVCAAAHCHANISLF
jgi:hypothetical protein